MAQEFKPHEIVPQFGRYATNHNAVHTAMRAR